MPLAATLVSQQIFDAFIDDARSGSGKDARPTSGNDAGSASGGKQGGVFFHGHSYTGNQLGCAAALATLEIFERERVVENLQPKIRLMGELLDEFRGLEAVAEVRQCGFIGVVELTGSSGGYSYGEAIGRQACDAVLSDGVLLRPLGNVVYFMPPYCIAEEQLAHMMRSMRRAIEALG